MFLDLEALKITISYYIWLSSPSISDKKGKVNQFSTQEHKLYLALLFKIVNNIPALSKYSVFMYIGSRLCSV